MRLAGGIHILRGLLRSETETLLPIHPANLQKQLHPPHSDNILSFKLACSTEFAQTSTNSKVEKVPDFTCVFLHLATRMALDTTTPQLETISTSVNPSKLSNLVILSVWVWVCVCGCGGVLVIDQ